MDHENHAIYGSAKIAEELQKRDELETACRHAVAKAVQEMGLWSRVSKTFTPTTTKADPSKRPAPNMLDRDFTTEAPNQKCVTEITYLPTLAGWVYLAVVLDLFSRRVVGWETRDSLGDYGFCMAGVLLARRIPRWTSLILELTSILWNRDSLILNTIMLLYLLDAIRQWQLG